MKTGRKTALTTGLTTDRKNFDFRPQRGIIAKTEYPGVAELVPRHIWDVEIARSNRVTRTKNPLKSADFRGFLLIPCYCGAGVEELPNFVSACRYVPFID